ncbi:MAG TPA: TOBE domain-containing protein, partial [Roseiflexaceae bacterium]
EQIGTPFEIYNFPTTRFVASFVGTLNVLAASVTDAAGGRVVVDGQEIRAAQPIAGAPAGRPITVALRPEIISTNGASSGNNRLTGTVDDVMFLGPTVRIRVRFKDQSLQFDEFNNPHLTPPERGQPITVSFPPEACLILAESQPAAPAE